MLPDPQESYATCNLYLFLSLVARNGSCGNSKKHLSNGDLAHCNGNGKIGNGQGEKETSTLLEEQAVVVCPVSV